MDNEFKLISLVKRKIHTQSCEKLVDVLKKKDCVCNWTRPAFPITPSSPTQHPLCVCVLPFPLSLPLFPPLKLIKFCAPKLITTP